jgi:hypothetical protein
MPGSARSVLKGVRAMGRMGAIHAIPLRSGLQKFWSEVTRTARARRDMRRIRIFCVSVSLLMYGVRQPTPVFVLSHMFLRLWSAASADPPTIRQNTTSMH